MHSSQDGSDIVADRQKFYNSKPPRWRLAIAHFTVSLALGHPDAALVHSWRGAAFDGLREFRSAFIDHDKAITLLAGSDMAKLPPPRLWAIRWFNRGLCRTRVKDFEAAAADFKSALQIDPKCRPAQDELGKVKKILAKQAAERVSSLQGLLEAAAATPAAKADKAFGWAVTSQPAAGGAKMTGEMRISNTEAGVLIGPSGMTIAGVRHKTGAQITVFDTPAEAAAEGERCRRVCVVGVHPAVEKAKSEIYHLLGWGQAAAVGAQAASPRQPQHCAFDLLRSNSAPAATAVPTAATEPQANADDDFDYDAPEQDAPAVVRQQPSAPEQKEAERPWYSRGAGLDALPWQDGKAVDEQELLSPAARAQKRLTAQGGAAPALPPPSVAASAAATVLCEESIPVPNNLVDWMSSTAAGHGTSAIAGIHSRTGCRLQLKQRSGDAGKLRARGDATHELVLRGTKPQVAEAKSQATVLINGALARREHEERQQRHAQHEPAHGAPPQRPWGMASAAPGPRHPGPRTSGSGYGPGYGGLADRSASAAASRQGQHGGPSDSIAWHLEQAEAMQPSSSGSGRHEATQPSNAPPSSASPSPWETGQEAARSVRERMEAKKAQAERARHFAVLEQQLARGRSV